MEPESSYLCEKAPSYKGSEKGLLRISEQRREELPTDERYPHTARTDADPNPRPPKAAGRDACLRASVSSLMLQTLSRLE